MFRITLGLVVVLACSAMAGEIDPASAAKSFYRVYAALHDQQSGIPDATGRLRLSAVLSARLNSQLSEAAQAQARLSAKVRNAVPPSLEGDIFSSLFEGATRWKVGTCTNDGKKALCRVSLSHDQASRPDGKASAPQSWTDTVVLVNSPQGWKVDDIIYDAGLSIGNTGRLSEILDMVVEQSR